jgi:hypothetical protein
MIAKKTWKEAAVACSRYTLGSYLKELRKTAKTQNTFIMAKIRARPPQNTIQKALPCVILCGSLCFCWNVSRGKAFRTAHIITVLKQNNKHLFKSGPFRLLLDEFMQFIVPREHTTDCKACKFYLNTGS